MRAFVFTDASLARDAGRYVWLSIDTENAKNASFREKFPVDALPTLFIIDPKTEKVAIRWVGGADVAQLEKMFTDGEHAVRGHEKGIDEALARADKLYGEGKNAEAATAYREVLKKAPANWPRYGRTVESLLFALASTNATEECAKLARDAYPKLRDTVSAANVAASGCGCALALDEKIAQRAKLIEELKKDSLDVLANSKVKFAADDISAVYGTLADEREAAKDEAGKKKVGEEWAHYLESQAAAAATPDGRAVFDSHRVGVYLLLGQPERGIEMLKASERDLPKDYNPPARLAVLYKAMKKWDEALAASDRALEKAYGPRKIGILSTRADIYTGKGDKGMARQTIEEAVRFAESLPVGQRSDRTIASLKKKLESS